MLAAIVLIKYLSIDLQLKEKNLGELRAYLGDIGHVDRDHIRAD